MTVNSAKNLSEDYNKDSNYVRTYSQSWYVDATVEESALNVEQAPDLPRVGQAHPQDSGVYVNSLSAKRSMDTILGDGSQVALRKWDVTVNYSSDASNTYSPLSNQPKKPWQMGAYNYVQETKTYSKTLDKAVELDSTNNWVRDIPVTNTLGDLVNVKIEVNNTIVRFSYDIVEFKSEWVTAFVGSTNYTAINIASDWYLQSEARINKLSRKAKKWEDGEQYWTIDVELEVEIGVPVAYIQLLNAGYNFNNTEGSNVVARPIQFKDGEYGWFDDTDLNITEVVALTEEGTIANLKTNPELAYYLDFNTAIPREWSILGFPEEIEERS